MLWAEKLQATIKKRQLSRRMFFLSINKTVDKMYLVIKNYFLIEKFIHLQLIHLAYIIFINNDLVLTDCLIKNGRC